MMHHPRYTTALPKKRLGLFVQVVVVDLRAVAGSLVGSSRLWVVFTFLNMIDLSPFVTPPLWSEWEISVDCSTQLLHNRRNQSRQDLSLLSNFQNITSLIFVCHYHNIQCCWCCKVGVLALWYLPIGFSLLLIVSCKLQRPVESCVSAIWMLEECRKCFFYAKKVWLEPAGETKIGRGRSSNSSKDDLSVVLGEFDLSTQSDEFDINR